MPESPGVGAAFNASVQTYDAERRLLIPCFDDFYGIAVGMLSEALAHGGRVLDLGAGTGLFSSLIHARFPRASFVLMDVADAMLGQAALRLAGATAEIRQADYARIPFEGPYRAVVSALSIHHLSDEEKAAVYAKAFRALVPGGVFVNADQVLGPNPELEQLYRDQWQADVRRAGASEDMIARAQERMTYDRMAPLADQLRWLRDAGFANVDCLYKNFSFVVMAGRKPG